MRRRQKASRRSGMQGARDAEAAEGVEETSRRTPRSAPHPRPQRPPLRNGRRKVGPRSERPKRSCGQRRDHADNGAGASMAH